MREMDSENAIEVVDVWKSYRTGAIRGRTLLNEIESFWAKCRGKEDPNSKIIARESLTLKTSIRNDKFWALKGITFNVKKGETVAILGRNGAGKSTLLRILSRITESDRGIVKIRGKVASLLGAGVGFNIEMTGRENVYLNGSILGMTPREISERMDSIAEFAEIPEFLDTPVKRYSSGMQARLGFSVAVHLDSEIMILDEVFATGDRVFRMKCIEKMRELVKGGRTVLIVTHMPDLLKGLCYRGIVIKEGNTCFDGDINKAIDLYYQKEELVEVMDDSGTHDPCSINRVEIVSVHFFDGNGIPLNAIKGDEAFVVEVEVTSFNDSKKGDIVFIMSHKRTGAISRISYCENESEYVDLGRLNRFKIKIDKLHLNSVLEKIHFALRIFDNENERILVGENVSMVDLEKNSVNHAPGFLIYDHHWEVK